ncbi:hypothetical protein HMPREF1624_01520 [Sporothrix schenckii ATCC 58251]|uniref:Plasma membrane proteolipid 3 n=1 Tax=Sporothrix schenckii (strain ATCC 58251 / de Perez 2211183) TaxID=1391915 RepID=U7Q5P5_SPOS1|nr:hypothetical protein HMPREF1624_01520 [Sporothrix schenckii ATCC 58251]
MSSADIFLGLLALLFPPLAVWVKRGICSADSVINILLCVLGYIPGLIHAWYIIAKFPEPDYEYEVLNQDAENNGRVTYVVVHGSRQHGSGRGTNANNRHHVTTNGPAGADSNAVQSAAPKIQDNVNYGTASTGSPAAAAGSSAHDNGGEGGSDAPPPSYAQVVAGDNKVQSQE